MDRIYLAQYRGQCRAIVNTVMKIRVRKMLEALEQLHNWQLLDNGSAQ
jgi:hypothetical protein